MQSSLSTLQRVQAARAVAPTEAVVEPPPVSASLEGLRKRNAALDALFYDVAVVTPDEARTIGPWLAWEGSMLHVPPSGVGEIRVCHTLDDLAALERADSLAVAGVGSSALGSAAFARNVADATGRPVIAVVSGYGLSDLATEALGGWFLFGSVNRARRATRLIDDAFGIHLTGTPRLQDYARSARDTKTVMALLRDPRFEFRLLTAHSKGNLVLAEALEAIVEDTKGKLPLRADTKIVTVSAAIEMPRAFTDIVDVMGAWDWFGGLNSRLTIPIDVTVPKAWHHTNREIPFHLPVTDTLRDILDPA